MTNCFLGTKQLLECPGTAVTGVQAVLLSQPQLFAAEGIQGATGVMQESRSGCITISKNPLLLSLLLPLNGADWSQRG